MSDEIRKDDREELEKKFNQMMSEGKLAACPNLTHLPKDQKDIIAKKVLKECMEMLMKTYISIGLLGEAVLGAHDGFTGNKFKLIFKAMKEDDKDEHLNG